MICSQFCKEIANDSSIVLCVRHTLNSRKPFRLHFQSQANSDAVQICSGSIECGTSTLTVNMDEHDSGVCECVYVCMKCTFIFHFLLYCAHKQFETRIYAYLLFHGRCHQWMHTKWRVRCKSAHTKCNCLKDKRSEESSERADNSRIYMWMWWKRTCEDKNRNLKECEGTCYASNT